MTPQQRQCLKDCLFYRTLDLDKAVRYMFDKHDLLQHHVEMIRAEAANRGPIMAREMFLRVLPCRSEQAFVDFYEFLRNDPDQIHLAELLVPALPSQYVALPNSFVVS
jgi:hypothetical protein